MVKLKILAVEVGCFRGKLEELCEEVVRWTGGVDVLLLPEFLWFSACGDEDWGAWGDRLWKETLPKVANRLPKQGFFVLGSAPFRSATGVRNRAVVVMDGQLYFQDKLHLTPFETEFEPGTELNIFEWQDHKVAVNICFDVEFPEVSVALRQNRVDLLLVPSSTETPLGVERVTRTASARAVETGAFVATTHLLGPTEIELFDQNWGRVGFFTPSQSSYLGADRERVSDVVAEGTIESEFEIDFGLIAQQQNLDEETNPRCKTSVKFDQRLMSR